MPTTYVYRRQGSEGAAALADALGARRWRDLRTPLSNKAVAGDSVICWGESFAKTGVRVLNGGPLRSKFTDAEMLAQAGVPTIQVSRTRPRVEDIIIPAGPDPAVPLWERVAELAEDFLEDEVGTTITRIAPRLRHVDDLASAIAALRTSLASPAPTETRRPAEANGEWLGRANDHVGGTDLLRGGATDYFTRRETLVREFRVHSFLGRSIRAGIKVHREGFPNPHEWIRSWDGGWRISYDGETVRQAHRDLAHRAIEALGLDFGAVDMGQRQDGTLIVLEVNRAPGLEGGTIEAYVRAINRWLSGEWATRQPVQEHRRAA